MTRVMGVVNVTPDSFFAGSRAPEPGEAVTRGLELVEQGADLLDVGGESTRPGHRRVPADEQIHRIVPVVGELSRRTAVPISVDTTLAPVAAAALDAGAAWINDTSALQQDPDLGPLVAARRCPLVLMHRFEPPRPVDAPSPGRALVAEIRDRLADAVARAGAAGIDRSQLVLDPGLGFGTAHADNPTIIANLDVLRSLALPLLVGPSRKRFIGHLTGRDVGDRLAGTAGAVAALALEGVEVVRVHDVAAMCDVVRVAAAVRAARGGGGV